MSLVPGRGRDHLSPSLIDLRHVHGHVQGEGGGAAGQDQSLEEGDLYQKRSAKDLQSTDPSPGKEKEKDQALGITERQEEPEVEPQVVGVGVTLRAEGGGLDLWEEEGVLAFPPAAGAAPLVAGAAPPAEGAVPPVEGVAPLAEGAAPPAEGAAPLAVGGDQGLW